MVVEARFQFRHHGCYSEKLAPGVRVLHMGGDGARCLAVMSGASPEHVDRFFEAMAGWTDSPPEILERNDHSAIVRCHCPTRGLVAKLIACDVSVLWPVVHAEGLEWYTLVAPTRAHLSAAAARMREAGEILVERVNEVDAHELSVQVPLYEVTRGLSQRQLAALGDAIAKGYYGTPRKVDAADLARGFGVSRSTFQEHLQKAETRVMESFARVLALYPGLRASARKGPGRPRK